MNTLYKLNDSLRVMHILKVPVPVKGLGPDAHLWLIAYTTEQYITKIPEISNQLLNRLF